MADNVIGRCRNNFIRVTRARGVTVSGNVLRGPLVPGASTNQGSGQGSANVDPGSYDPIHIEDAEVEVRQGRSR